MSQFKRNLAIIIGINNYQSGIPALKTATNDANKIAHILESKHNYKVWGLLDEKATLANCLRMLEKFLPNNIQESDRLMFYFAGHGIALNGDDGPEGFLIPQDARLGDTSTYLPMVRLQKALDKLPCRHFLTILDCCFAGAFRWSSTRKLLVVPDVIHRQHYDRFIEAPAWQVITSASHNQTASDGLALKDDRGVTIGNHSPFAAALIEALQGAADYSPPGKNGQPPGNGVITASELYLYLRDRVELATEKNGAIQTPGLYPLNKHDRGEYIFHSPGKKLDLSTAPPLDESQNPYRGLESFNREHSKLFFGRQALTKKLYQFCQQNSLTVVLGASGTGKSSLVKAGLIPYLEQLAQDKNHWQVLPPMRPGEFPFKELNKILSEHGSSGSSIVGLIEREKRTILAKKLERLLAFNPQAKFLLVIDQSEELITLCKDSAIRDDFLELLDLWLTTYSQKLHIVITLRSDFEPQFRNLALKSSWQKARFIVPAMTREELRDAIEKPAAARVMYFEPYSLVDRLIDEVAQMPGALPLLSFALSELYLKYLLKFRAGTRDKRAITQEDYLEIGGVTQSLTQRADLEYDKLVKQDTAYAQTIRYVMLRMIAVGGGELARRRVPLAELRYPAPENERVKQIIKNFSAARLLVQGQNADWQPYVEPAHDALVRGWQKLLVWKQEESESLLLQRRLTPVAEEWKTLAYNPKYSGWRTKTEPIANWLDARFYAIENLFYISRDWLLGLIRQMSKEQRRLMGKPEQYLWNTNPYLSVLKEKLSSNNYLFNQIEAEFLKLSIRRRRNNRRRLIASVSIVMLSLSTLTVIAVWQEEQARKAKKEAVEAQAELARVSRESQENARKFREASDSKEQLEAELALAKDRGASEEELNRIDTQLARAQAELSQAEEKTTETEQKLDAALTKSDRILTRFSDEDVDGDAVDNLDPDSTSTSEDTNEDPEVVDGEEDNNSETAGESEEENIEAVDEGENDNPDLESDGEDLEAIENDGNEDPEFVDEGEDINSETIEESDNEDLESLEETENVEPLNEDNDLEPLDETEDEDLESADRSEDETLELVEQDLETLNESEEEGSEGFFLDR